MVSKKIYIEGGGESKELNSRCRQGFRKLLEQCGLKGRMPQLIASGSRGNTFSDFSTALAEASTNDFVAMLIDSEDSVEDIEKTWAHLKKRDGWNPPDNAQDEQVFFMTTCMETWIAADRATLRRHYAGCLRENVLPPLSDMETRDRQSVQNALVHASRDCDNQYQKGKRSFELLGKLNPTELLKHLPSFARFVRILKRSM